MKNFDMLIKNAKIIDGTGNPGYRADVGVNGSMISFIGDAKNSTAEMLIEADGFVLSPGFIDMHAHSDNEIFADRTVYNKVEQGITTEVSGMCGLTLAPVSPNYFEELKKYLGFFGDDAWSENKWKTMTTFGVFLDEVEKLPLATNVAFCVGQGTIRIAVMGFENRIATDKELEQMKALVGEAMEGGALGLSTGLIYPPGVYTPTDEIVELCKVVAEYGGTYISHIRNESHDLVNAIKEAIEIGRQAGVPVNISHLKVAGRLYWGTSVETLKLIEDANSNGIEVTADQYPYKAGSTALKSTIPPQYHEGGTEKLLERLKDPAIREQVKAEIQIADNTWENLVLNCGLEGVLVLTCKQVPEAVGKTVEQYAEEQNIDPLDALIDLVVESEGAAVAAYFMMADNDIERIMQHPYIMIGTDGGIVDPREGSHPRAMGTFPKVLGRYVREKKVLLLEDAIRKMTSLPALKAGFKSKGLVKEGFDADLVIFNPDSIIDRATYQQPALRNEGIEYVIVNGEVAVYQNKYTGIASGKVIKH